MHRKVVSILFTVLFLALITAPSIIVVMDDSVDVSVFYSLSEEEEEEQTNLNLSFVLENLEDGFVETSKKTDNLGYYFKNYPKPHQNLLFPPPEFIL
ncbi:MULTISPECIES: hypothetical protein [unclassified Olleya]|uniref:hypothetical protein n=1 Tax=unclassified Olleya TaxID=2615019 RepID=UPI000C31A2F4|nr:MULTISPECIES: hypothetical protein [unclassified Olleya]AUC74542.1 hypothetical protein CW732_02140 [Olleya sp. Bg11-27]QXP60468.1 hypothetical protein H0I26_02135 [Olleya sp. HaHaR_3_96]